MRVAETQHAVDQVEFWCRTRTGLAQNTSSTAGWNDGLYNQLPWQRYGILWDGVLSVSALSNMKPPPNICVAVSNSGNLETLVETKLLLRFPLKI